MAESVDLVKSLAKTVDDIVDKIIGGRPVERALSILEDIAPATVARKLGVPPPGDLVDQAVAQAEAALRSGTLPRPPSPSELMSRR